MISTLFKSFKLTIAFSLLFSICYIFVLWIFAQVAGPNKGNAESRLCTGTTCRTGPRPLARKRHGPGEC